MEPLELTCHERPFQSEVDHVDRKDDEIGSEFEEPLRVEREVKAVQSLVRKQEYAAKRILFLDLSLELSGEYGISRDGTSDDEYPRFPGGFCGDAPEIVLEVIVGLRLPGTFVRQMPDRKTENAGIDKEPDAGKSEEKPDEGFQK